MFRLLFVGDIVGEAGCATVEAVIPALRRELELDAVIANGENSAPGGRGITPESGSTLLSVVDFLTLGNHAFDAQGGKELLEREPRVIRPANMDEDATGRGWGVFEAAGLCVGVANVQGRVFMRDETGSPFAAADRAVEALKSSGVDLILVDVHAEATSEKQAMGYHLAGRAQAVVGTHTHVATVDTRLLSGGTAYVSDVGMTGITESVIGFEKGDFMDLFFGKRPARIEVATKGPAALNAVLVEVENGRALGIERVHRVSSR